MPKYQEIAQLLERRIRQGDYILKGIPAERELALEVGVSQRTARRAMLELVESGTLIRQPNGRLVVADCAEGVSKPLRIALVASAWPSALSQRWVYLIDQLVQARGWQFRVVHYHHLDDPIILAAVSEFDGVFFIPEGDIPDSLQEELQKSKCPMVVVGPDLSASGLVSFQTVSPVFVRHLVDHLHSLGHRRIDFLNTQPVDAVIQQRIENWELWTAKHDSDGVLFNHPVKHFENARDAAYAVVKKQFEEGRFDSTALICATADVAIGALRAIYEQGLRIGVDVSLCSTDDDGGRAQWMTPPLTCIPDPDALPFISLCMGWMSRRGEPWKGPMLLQSHDIQLFIGKSTGRLPERGLDEIGGEMPLRDEVASLV